MRYVCLFSLLLLLSAGTGSPVAQTPGAGWRVGHLRCEFLETPLGIGELRPRLSWQVASDRRAEKQSAYRLLVATTRERLEPGQADLWDTGQIDSDRTTHIVYDGTPLVSRQRAYWRIISWNRDKTGRAEGDSWWEMGLLQAADWKGQWIGLTSASDGQKDRPAPSPYLERAFSVDRPVARARLYATALGTYELHLNGKRVGEDVFAPGWTDYSRRLQYQTYDVTSLVRSGNNRLGAILGDGWYAGTIGWEAKRHHYGPYPLGFLAQLHIDYSDGSSQVVTTDRTWLGITRAILASDLLMGETYDGRLAADRWTDPAGDGFLGDPVTLLPPPAVPPVAQQSQPVRRTGEIPARAMSEPSPGTYIFDLGQNMVGWARLKIEAPRGAEIKLRFAEMLQPDGHLYTANLRTARATDTYIARGGSVETFEPHFTFHGFRYVELTGVPSRPSLDAVTGIVVHSATPPTGTFESSSAMLNQLQQNIVWSQRGNFLSIPTDCPQRDERLGWMGDAEIFARTACFNMDVAAFFTKWMDDVQDAQSGEGGFPDVAPRLVATTDGAPGWGDAGVIVPWTMYACYGDERILERHYQAMRRWVAYVQQGNPDLLWRNRVGNNYGDWVSIQSDTPKDVLATAFFAQSAKLVGQIARVLGHAPEANELDALFERIKASFNAAFVDADGHVAGRTQTSYALALEFDLLPASLRPAATAFLVRAIEEKDWHLSTGFLGVRHLLPALAHNGRLDVAYRLLMNDTFPSWGYSIRNGATSIWERWDGWTEAKGFQDPGMNSFNHYSFGSVGEWMYRYVAGIDTDPDAPGYRRLVIHPQPGGGLTSAKATYASIQGPIVSAWRNDAGRFELNVEIPANTTATVYVPSRGDGVVQESGRPATTAEGVTALRQEDGFAVFRVESGRYRFESTVN